MLNSRMKVWCRWVILAHPKERAISNWSGIHITVQCLSGRALLWLVSHPRNQSEWPNDWTSWIMWSRTPRLKEGCIKLLLINKTHGLTRYKRWRVCQSFLARHSNCTLQCKWQRATRSKWLRNINKSVWPQPKVFKVSNKFQTFYVYMDIKFDLTNHLPPAGVNNIGLDKSH